jgi:serine/threonine protein kinase
MGIVYRCQDGETGEQVAVKRITPLPGVEGERRFAWFYKEACALASLDHPSIVGARDFGRSSDGAPYLAMDFAPGVSLHEFGNTKPTFAIIWSIVDQILGALAHAHARGVIHGDLKPSNIVVHNAPAGLKVALLDFGLAWVKQNPVSTSFSGLEVSVAAAPTGAGTPGYMAPEQAKQESHHVCGASDIYALGCMLYKLLGGSAPFEGDSKEVQRSHAYRVPASLRPTLRVPRGVSDFVMRCLDKKPWRRFEFAGEARRVWAGFEPGKDSAHSWHFSLRRLIARSPIDSEARPSPAAVPPSMTRHRGEGLLGLEREPMVGRHQVRRRLLDICHAVRQQKRSRIVFLVGDEGVGKSHLSRWLLEDVHEEGRMVPLSAHYGPNSRGMSAVRDAALRHYNFEQASRQVIEESLRARWEVAGDDEILRAWATASASWLRPDPLEDALHACADGNRSADRVERVRRLESHVLSKIAAARSVLLVLDDLHLASPEECENLLHLLRRDRPMPLLIVATVEAKAMRAGRPSPALTRLWHSTGAEVMDLEHWDPDFFKTREIGEPT